MIKRFRKGMAAVLCIPMIFSLCFVSIISASAAYSFLFPVENGRIAYYYGYSASYGANHTGIDIHSSGNDTIYAACDGVVDATANSCYHVSCGYQCEHYSTYGNYIRVRNSDGTYAYYGHLLQNSLLVSTGSTVKKGQAIAQMGSSGYSTGKHLHFEVRLSNRSTTVNVNPTSNGGSVEYSYSGYGISCDTPVDLGTEFYASISHLASWNHLTVEEDGNVDICYETYRANQYWKFYRQYDGSYKIVSAYNGKCLDVQGGSQESGANVQVHNDNNTDAQRWYIYKQGNDYQLKPKCSDCVIEMNAWNFYQGVNLVVGTKDNSDAEIFAINWRDFNIIGTTDLNILQDNYGYVNFSWTPALCATNYNVKIWNGSSVQPGEAPINLWNVKNNNISLNLGSGTFTAYLESYNALGDYVQGQAKTFSVNLLDYIPAHTVIYNSHMYSIYNTPTSWENAKLVCEQMGGYLATITSKEEQNVIEGLLDYGNLKYYHLGANNLSASGNWEWVTNELFDYTNWAEGEPNNVLGIENYLSLFNVDAYKGKWNDTSNSASSGVSNGFICEIEIDLIPVAETIYNNHKYQLFDTSLSWEAAKEFCENSGGTLCIIDNVGEQEAIQELLSKGNKELYWLGAFRQDNDFSWLNGQAVMDGYTNYSSGEPNNFNGVENYLQISNGDDTKYKWNDHRNMPNDSSYGFICEYDNSPFTLGDANCDGTVNLLDAVLAQKAALSMITIDEQGTANADTNGDGKITLFDAIAIQKLALSVN